MRFLSSIAYVAILGILSHYVGELLPRTWFVPTRFPYKSLSFEKNGKIYEKLGVKKWKNRLPDMSRIMRDMLPKRITREATSENISALIKETCVAECIHKLLNILSIGIYLIWKNGIGVFLACVYIICNIPFIIIQRYNRPNLIRLQNKLSAREARINAISDTVM